MVPDNDEELYLCIFAENSLISRFLPWNSNFRATQNATIHNKVSQQAYKEIGILEINCGIRSLL
jgi:hypothetical protein